MDKTHIAAAPAYTPMELRREIRTLVCEQQLDFADEAAACWTLFGGLSLDGIDVFRNEGIGTRRGYRTQDHIRDDGVADFLISMPRSARITLSHAGGALHVRPGQIAFVPLSRPCHFEIAPGNSSEPFSMTHVKVSGAMLRQRVPHMDACCHRVLELNSCAGKAMKALFDVALTEGADLSAAEAPHFSQILIDAVTNVLRTAPELATLNDSASLAHVKIREAGKNFIERHLANPQLSVADVARHCHVSVRYLHKVFSSASESVSGYIRENRLHECRAALQARTLRDKSITEIAMMWGFNNSSTFCRAYRLRFGLTPSDDRSRTH